MPSCRDICAILAGVILEYQTPKIVTVRSWKIGAFNRIIQILIVTYVILFAIVYKKGYQEFDVAQSNVVTKVKGVASTKHRDDLPETYRRVWDTADYVIPPQENGAFFVMTNAIITDNQTQGTCQEDPDITQCNPKATNPCPKGESAKNGNGIYTGECNPSPVNESLYTCQIEAWCPVEHDQLKVSGKPLLPQAYNFTVLIKNNIEFPKFNVKRRNIIAKINNNTYLKDCHYNEVTDPFCPVFQLGYIVQRANSNFDTIATQGGIINIVIQWTCNLDFAEDYCIPKYSFSRLDDENVQISPGWNFRYANYYHTDHGNLTRDLIKTYGILFVFSVEGKAGKFNIVPLILNIGAGLAILSIATIICDIILIYCLPRRQYYSGKKYLRVVDDDFSKFNSDRRRSSTAEEIVSEPQSSSIFD